MGTLDAYAPIIDRIEALARARGLSFAPVYFRVTDSDELAEVASIGACAVNPRPSHAFLRASNTYLQNVLVIAHVFGHVDFFANNHWYRKSNKNMLNEAELHARLIRHYEARVGKEHIEKLLDALLTVATTVNAFERTPEAH